MIELVTRAEERLARGRRNVFAPAALPRRSWRRRPRSRRSCAAWRRWSRTPTTAATSAGSSNSAPAPDILNFVNGADVGRYSQAGVTTPDHVIRTKAKALILPAPRAGALDAFAEAARAALEAYFAAYKAYFERNNAASRVQPKKKMLDPMPRVMLVPGLGLFAVGKSAKDARVNADVYAERDQGDHRGGGHRRVHQHLRSRHVRRGVLVARAGEARQGRGEAAGAPGGAGHRRRQRHRRRHRRGVRGARAPRSWSSTATRPRPRPSRRSSAASASAPT